MGARIDTLSYLYGTAGRLSQFKRGATVLTSYTYTAGTSTIATGTDGIQGTVFTYDWARRKTSRFWAESDFERVAHRLTAVLDA